MTKERRAPRFGAVVTAMATPFSDDGALDLDGAVRLAHYLVETGSDGLVIAGSTGEGSTLSDAEKLALFRAVSAAVDVPVIAGSTSNDTAHSIELTVAAERAGVSGILAVAPYYSRPPQSGIEAHLRSIAASTSLPLVIYDIPVRTGRKVATEILLRLFEQVDNIVALKDAAGSPAETARLIASAPDGFECYAGDDGLLLPLLSVGAVGLIGVATHWVAREAAEIVAAYKGGDVERAFEVNRALLDSYSFETSEHAPNPIPTKAMLRVLGLPAGQCRLPLGDAPTGLEDAAKVLLSDLEHWRQTRR